MSGAGPGHDLGAWTSPEVAAHAPVLLVPLGSTEQHGPHLPLDTDTRIALGICAATAASLSATTADGGTTVVAVAPAVAYGASGEHEAFAGTVSIGQEAFERTVVELVRSARRHHRLVVLVNAHGGNAEALTRALRTLDAERRGVMAWSPTSAAAAATDAGGSGASLAPDRDSHAGRIETSVLLALAPEVVHLDRAESGVTAPLSELMDDLRAGGVAAVSPNGVLGDPAGASAEEGRRIVAAWVADLRRVVTTRLDCRS